MKNGFSLKADFAAKPEQIFKAWLSSDGHSAMSGSPAKVEPRVGGSFSAWDGYITGKTVELRPYSRIVQAWRTSEFSDTDPDSKLVIDLEPVGNRTLLTLTHTEIPADQVESYKAGWTEWYLEPMQEYFKE